MSARPDWLKPARDLCPGDVVVINGIPVDIRDVVHQGEIVYAIFSDNFKDWECWSSEFLVPVITHFEAKIDV